MFLIQKRWKKEIYYPDTLPQDIKKQVKIELSIALTALPFMAFVMTPFALLVSKGYSKMYYNVDDYGWMYLFLSVPLCLFLTGIFFLEFFFLRVFLDMMIYFVHRGLHIPIIYQHIHKLHHTFRFTTPFSSHAFHPLDGWSQVFILSPCSYLLTLSLLRA